MFFYSELYIQNPGDNICLTQTVIFSSTTNFFTNIYVFCLHYSELWRPLRKHWLSSVGSKGHICRLVVQMLIFFLVLFHGNDTMNDD